MIKNSEHIIQVLEEHLDYFKNIKDNTNFVKFVDFKEKIEQLKLYAQLNQNEVALEKTIKIKKEFLEIIAQYKNKPAHFVLYSYYQANCHELEKEILDLSVNIKNSENKKKSKAKI